MIDLSDLAFRYAAGDFCLRISRLAIEPGERVVVSPVELPVDGMSLRDAEGATR